MQHDEELNSFILVGDTGEELGQVNLLIQSSTAFQQENNNDLNELMNDDFFL